MNRLLVSVPVVVGLEHWAPNQHLAILAVSGFGVVPLAAWMGATERLAEHLGDAAHNGAASILLNELVYPATIRVSGPAAVLVPFMALSSPPLNGGSVVQRAGSRSSGTGRRFRNPRTLSTFVDRTERPGRAG
jgi:hypothetical protein